MKTDVGGDFEIGGYSRVPICTTSFAPITDNTTLGGFVTTSLNYGSGIGSASSGFTLYYPFSNSTPIKSYPAYEQSGFGVNWAINTNTRIGAVPGAWYWKTAPRSYWINGELQPGTCRIYLGGAYYNGAPQPWMPYEYDESKAGVYQFGSLPLTSETKYRISDGSVETYVWPGTTIFYWTSATLSFVSNPTTSLSLGATP